MSPDGALVLVIVGYTVCVWLFVMIGLTREVFR